MRSSLTSRTAVYALVVLLLTTSSLAGCLGGDDDAGGGDPFAGSPITLVVYYNYTAGMIETVMGPGGGTTGAEFSFDYAKTTSEEGNMAKFFFTPGDGTDAIEADATQESVITYEYGTHGLFTAVLAAEDINGNYRNSTITIRVDAHLTQTDTNCGNNCADTTIDTTPDGTAPPARVEVLSNVTNPPGWLLQPGGPSTVSWSLENASSTEVGTGSAQVADGSDESWSSTQEAPDLGVWTLKVTVDSGDNIDYENHMWVHYPEDESPTNPDPGEPPE